MPPRNPDGGSSTDPATVDFVSAEDYTVEELRAAIFGNRRKQPPAEETAEPPERLDPVLAVSLLGRKEYEGLHDDLQELLVDEGRDVRLRHNAALALGRAAGAAAEQPLLQALERGPPEEVQRGILKALQAAGSDATLELLGERGDEFPDALTTLADWTESLLAFRTNTSAASEVGRLSLPDRTSIDGDQFQIAVRPATDELRDPVMDALSQGYPGLPFEPHEEAVYVLEALGRQLVLVLDAAFLDEAGRPLDAKHVAGGLLERDDAETGEWSPRYYVLVQPGVPERQQPDDSDRQAPEDGTVFVTTTAGRIHYGGPYTVEDGGIRFELRAVEHPGLRPIHIDGTFRDGDLVVEEAIVTDNAPAARELAPDDPPDITRERPDDSTSQR